MSPHPLFATRVHRPKFIHPPIPQSQSHSHSRNVKTTSRTNEVPSRISVFLLACLPYPLCDDLPYTRTAIVESYSERDGKQTGGVASHPVRQAGRAGESPTRG